MKCFKFRIIGIFSRQKLEFLADKIKWKKIFVLLSSDLVVSKFLKGSKQIKMKTVFISNYQIHFLLIPRLSSKSSSASSPTMTLISPF